MTQAIGHVQIAGSHRLYVRTPDSESPATLANLTPSSTLTMSHGATTRYHLLMREVDFIIVGQGLAGTCLAWELRGLGASVVVIDREATVTSSRVAAGLITPVTGKRLVKTWRWEELRAAAWSFYRRIEIELGCSLLRETSMVKVFASPLERDYFEMRMPDPEYAGLLRETTELPKGLSAPLGSCELLQGGQLDVAKFLDRSRERFATEGCYVSGELSLPEDVRSYVRQNVGELEETSTSSPTSRISLEQSDAEQQVMSTGVCPPSGEGSYGENWPGVELPRHGLRAQKLIFCQGIDARSNPWFSNVEFNPARGEMLIVRIPSWTEDRIIHGPVWIAPLATGDQHLYRVGSTYDWTQLQSGPTPEGRRSLVESLDQLLHVPYEIVDHQSAVRPILKHLNPVLGLHPRYPQWGYFNGLASKGALQAPFFARQFASQLVHQTPIERDVDIQHRVPWTMNNV